MDIFEGKDGFRLFKRKKDAEFVAERNSIYGEKELRVQKVRISNEKRAKESGVSVHSDLSIAARAPKEDDVGWIVLGEKEGFEELIEDMVDLIKD